jgi:tetratricopeptide (TPR) repeat protein
MPTLFFFLGMLFLFFAFMGLISPKMVLSKWGIKIGRLKTFALFFFLAFASVMVGGNLLTKQYEAERKKEEIESRKRIADNFKANKDKILQSIELLIDNKQFDLAKSEIEKHNIQDLKLELIPIKNKVEEAQLIEKNEEIPETNFDEKIKLYSKLIKINPDNKNYILALNSYKQKKDEHREKEKNKRIKMLSEKVRKLPRSKVNENLEIYKELLKLEPNNQKYQAKVKFYKEKKQELDQDNRMKMNSDLELLSWHWSESYGYVEAEGQVKNISGKKLDNIEVLVTWFDGNNNMITSESSLITYNPILPGQISPFRVMTSSNPAMSGASIEFKHLFGGKILTYRKNK